MRPLSSALQQRGAELIVFGNQRELDAYSECLSTVSTATTPGWADQPALSAAWYLTRAGSFARRQGANVVLYPAAQRRSCFHRPIPSVAVVHDLGQLNIDDKYDALRMFYFKQIALRLVVAAERKVAISESTRDHMVEALHLPRDQIRVVPNGVDSTRFVPIDAHHASLARMRSELRLEGPYLLYPARLEHPAKNHLRLLEAFAQSGLSETHTLALSGADWGGEGLIRERISLLGLEKSVRLLGFVPDAILPLLVGASEVVIMVGLTEGFGLPALEALAAGRPVCAAAAGALPEVVGDLGALCDPLDVQSISEALRKTIFDQEYRARCGAEGPHWARRWSWETTAASLAELCIEAAKLRSGH